MAGPPFCHGGELGIGVSRGQGSRQALCTERPSRLDKRGHLGNLDLGRLKRPDGLAKLLPLFHIVDRLLQGALRKPTAMGSNSDSGVVEKSHQLDKSVSLDSDEILLGDPHVVEIDIGGIRSADSHLSMDLVRLKPWPVCLNEKDAVALRFGGPIRMGQAENNRKLATEPLLIITLLPLITYSSPIPYAEVMTEAASLPASGSVIENPVTQSPLAKGGRYFFFCSSEPKRINCSDPKIGLGQYLAKSGIDPPELLQDDRVLRIA